MKAYNVYYSTAGNSTSALVLTESEETLELSLANKDKDYQIGSRYSSISHKKEVPLSNVMLKDLTVLELLRLLKDGDSE